MKHVLPYLCLLSIFACSAPAETISENNFPTVEPSTVGMNADSLALLDPYMKWAIDSQFIAGGVMLVAKDNKIVVQKAIGFADREKTEALTTDHIFRLASMTKPIVTMAVMQLYEQGKFNLSDPISMYIPEFKNPVVVENLNPADSTYTTRPAVNEITIHHLLTHTSGIGYGALDPVVGTVYAPFEIVEGWTKDSVLLKTNIPKFGKLPLMHDPGKKFTYGTSIDVLGYLVEILSGMPLDQYLQENIFTPLNMTDTYFYLPEGKKERLVDVWYTGNFDPAAVPASSQDDYPISGYQTYFSGGAGLSGTATDYLKFASALLNKGLGNGNRLLKEETVKLMMSNRIDSLYIGEAEQFGYGGSVFTGEGPIGQKPGRYSWAGFWQTNFWIDPDRNIVCIILTNVIYPIRWGPFFDRYEEIINHSLN